MSSHTLLTVDKLFQEPYASIVSYPRASRTELKKRLKELQKLGVEALDFVGEKQVSNLHVLGKGCVGIVVLAYRNGDKVALKIRRVDADRSRMQQEAELLREANSVDVGPKLLVASRNFLCMQFIDGMLFPRWLSGKRSRTRISTVLRQILKQCWRLDSINLDHGELSHAPKHVIVDGQDKPVIVDFESASLNRRPANVTSICQFLFIGSETAREMNRNLGPRDKKAIAGALRRYKNERTFENFRAVLNACRI
jgi:putative serine/threonine protein kinase